MMLGARTAAWSGKMSEPTLKQFFHDEIESIVIDADVTGYFPIVTRGKTNLKSIIHLGYGSVGNMSLISSSMFTGAEFEVVKLPIALSGDGFQNCLELREAHINTMSSASTWSFYRTGLNVVMVNVYSRNDTAEVIQGRANQYGAQWSHNIVFHGNDGNRVVYDSNSGTWVVEPDSSAMEMMKTRY